MDEPTLVARCQNGDEQAFAALFEAYHDRTFRMAYAISRNRSLAEEITQEAFVQAFRSVRNIRSGEPFGPWFYRLLVRLARKISVRRGAFLISLDAWRSEGREEPDPAAERELEQLDQRELVWSAMGGLSRQHREVLVLRYMADLTEEQIATVTDTPVGTVKSRLHHARRQLANKLRRERSQGLCPGLTPTR